MAPVSKRSPPRTKLNSASLRDGVCASTRTRSRRNSESCATLARLPSLSTTTANAPTPVRTVSPSRILAPAEALRGTPPCASSTTLPRASATRPAIGRSLSASSAQLLLLAPGSPHTRTSKVVPRMPIVALALRMRKAPLLRLLMKPVTARMPPRNKVNRTLSLCGAASYLSIWNTVPGRKAMRVPSIISSTATLPRPVVMTSVANTSESAPSKRAALPCSCAVTAPRTRVARPTASAASTPAGAKAANRASNNTLVPSTVRAIACSAQHPSRSVMSCTRGLDRSYETSISIAI